MDAEAVERDLVVSFVDALCSMCLTAVLRDDQVPLLHYMPQWLVALQRGAAAWRQAVDTGVGPKFVELE